MVSFFHNYFFVFLALLMGVAMATQAGVNTKLSNYVGGVGAAFISFLTGTIALFVCMLLSGASLGDLVKAKDAPPISWIGGVLGAFFVLVMINTVPRLGVALSVSLAIGGQMITALIIDHYGLFGVTQRSVSLMRIAGVILVMAGVVIIRKF